MKMKKIVNLYGGPGSGKSTNAAHLFALAKQNDINAELVREYIKNWVWEGRQIQPGDQIYIAAKQSKLERVCLKDVDLIVTDSPMMLSQYYEEKYDNTYPVCKHIIQKHNEIVADHGFEQLHVFLQRTKKYNPKGRTQTEEESKQVDLELKNLLISNNIEFKEVVADSNAAQTIFNLL